MKTYFFLVDILESTFSAVNNIDIRIGSFKVGGVETLTPEYWYDTQNGTVLTSGNGLFWAQFSEDGTTGSLVEPPGFINTWNPFANCLLLTYDLIGDAPRGFPTGTQNGNDYGAGLMNIGVDLPQILCGDGRLRDGAFFIDIDFTKDLYIEFDLITSLNPGSPYEEPYVIQKGFIYYFKDTCKKVYEIWDPITVETRNVNDYGFLAGVTKKDSHNTDPFLLIPCNPETTDCGFKELSRSFAMFVDVPSEVGEDPEKAFKECCYTHYVFADQSSNDDFKNDYSGFYHQKQIPNETVDFVLVDLSDNSETILNNGTFGDFVDFGGYPTNPKLKTFVIRWKKVLANLGEGSFKVIKRVTMLGTVYDFPSIVFTLRQYSSGNADKTTRIDVIMNGRLEKTKVNFTGTNFKHSIRVPGFFGRREPKFEEDFIVNREFEKRQISMKQSNEYKFQTNLVPSCVTSEIVDFMLFGNNIFMNDYNLNNHSYDFKKFGVKFANNEGTDYKSNRRKARLNLVFNDMFDNNLKRNF